MYTASSTTFIINVFMAVCCKNPVYGIVFLVISFCNSACLLIAVELEYIPLMLLIIYVGAIAVLFLFVIMMLNVRTIYLKNNNMSYSLLVLSCCLLMGVVVLYLKISVTLPINQTTFGVLASNLLKSIIDPIASNTNNINLKNIGSFLFTEH
jgi:NADH-quinone oxidoreductase subunit J